MATKEEILAAIQGMDDKEKQEIAKLLKIKQETSAEAMKAEEKYLANLMGDANKARDALRELNEEKMRSKVIDMELARLNNDYIGERKSAFEAMKVYEEFRLMAAQQGLSDEEQRQFAEREVQAITGQRIEQIKKLAIEFKKMGPVFKEGYKEGKKFATGLGTAIGIFSPKAVGLLKNFRKLGELSKDPKGLAGLQRGIKEIINPANILVSITAQFVAQTIKYASALDKATAAFAKSTGAGRMYTEEIGTLGMDFRNLGIDIEQSGKAYQTLFSSFTGFNELSKTSRVQLGKTVSQLETLGVSASDATGTINFMNLNLGKSAEESARMTEELALTGKAIGITMGQMTKGFLAASKTLAVYGEKSFEVFTNLAAQAKAAGVEVGTLLGLADKFDTFSSSADTAGKLNAILGSQISATEMLTMTEDQRIKTLISSIQAQGVAFKDMDRFTQKAIAQAAGINDMAEAQKIFGMSLGAYDDFRFKADAAAKEQEELAKMSKEAMDVMKKLSMIAMQFAIRIEPLVDMVASLAQKLLDLSEVADGFGGVMMLVLGGVAGTMAVLSLALLQFLPLIVSLIPALTGTSASMTAAGAASAAAAPGLTAGGTALLYFGAGVAAVLLPIALLGFSIAGIVVSFALLVASLALLVQMSKDVTSSFMIIAQGVSLMAVAMTLAGNPLALAGLATLTASIMSISYAINSIDAAKLESMADVMRGIGGAGGVAVDFGDMDAALNTMAEQASTIKPVLGDLALLTVGKTTQTINDNSAATRVNSLTAELRNIFNFNVEIPGSDIADAIDRRVKVVVPALAKSVS